MFFKNPNLSLKGSQLCVPLTAHSLDDLLVMVDNAVAEHPDLLEWRVDGFKELPSSEALTETLKAVSKHGNDTPILFTWRSHRDGGKHIKDSDFSRLSKWAMESGLIRLIDLELSLKPQLLIELIKFAEDHGVETIISHHDFNGTPPKEKLLALLEKMAVTGGSAVKFAVTPKSVEDVLTAMETMLEFKKSNPTVPLVGISMGKLGSVTRAWGHTLGSALIFAAADSISAPGQLSVKDIRHFNNVL